MAPSPKSNTRKNRKHRQRTNRNMRQRQRANRNRGPTMRQRQRTNRRRQGGGMCTLSPAPVDYSLAADGPSTESMKQGQEFAAGTKDYHGGGGLVGAPYGGPDSATLPAAMRASAGIGAQDEAFSQIKGMRDEGVVIPGQAGGRRRRHRKAQRKSRKHRKAHRKSRKNRKAQRKSRKQRQGGGGACLADTAGAFTKDTSDSMLLKDYSGAGLNVEWKEVASANGGDYLSPKN